MNELIKIEESNGMKVVSARELYKGLKATERFSNWFERYVVKYGFVENNDFIGCKVFNTLANQELQDYALTIDVAKHVCMLQRNENGMKFRQYFIDCEKKLSQLSHKHELALQLFDGGSGAIVAHKELLLIETEEIKAKHELELKLERDGNNKILSGVYEVVNQLNINGLTTTIFNSWMEKKGLIKYVTFSGEKKKTAQPTQLFFDYVSKTGFSLTTAPSDKSGKIKMIYTTAFVDRIIDNHMASLIEYTKLFS